MSTALPLRDVHLPPEPAWWPLAPGWWIVVGILVLLLAVPLLLRARRARRRRRWQRLFDDALPMAGASPERLAAIAGLLRRAARQHTAGNERLQGEAWLAWLDPDNRLPAEQRVLLLEGAYRPAIAHPAALQSLESWARDRFVALLMERRR